jgi:hypothetical protein
MTFVLLLCGSSYLAGSMFGHTSTTDPLGGMIHGEDVGVGRMIRGDNVRGESGNAVVKKCETTDEELIELHVKRGLEIRGRKAKGGGKDDSEATRTRRRFPTSSMGKSLNGVVRVTKDDINDFFDFGNPVDPGHGTSVEDALMLYQKKEAFPSSDEFLKRAVEYDDDGSGIPPTDAKTATENCDTMNVIFTNNPGNTRQCTAIMGNFESYHVQRWMKVDTVQSTPINPELPLVLVSRGYAQIGHGPKIRGKANFIAPPMEGKSSNVMKHWNRLLPFFQNVDSILEDLGGILKGIARNNAVVVLTCNMGQSALLMNFACNARRRGFDLGNVLVFPSDAETKDLAEGLGLTTYYDDKVSLSICCQYASDICSISLCHFHNPAFDLVNYLKNMGPLPKGEARRYGGESDRIVALPLLFCAIKTSTHVRNHLPTL